MGLWARRRWVGVGSRLEEMQEVKVVPLQDKLGSRIKKNATQTLVCCPAAMEGRTFTPCGQVLLQVAPVSAVVDALVVTHQAEGDALPVPAVKVGLAAAL